MFITLKAMYNMYVLTKALFSFFFIYRPNDKSHDHLCHVTCELVRKKMKNLSVCFIAQNYYTKFSRIIFSYSVRQESSLVSSSQRSILTMQIKTNLKLLRWWAVSLEANLCQILFEDRYMVSHYQKRLTHSSGCDLKVQLWF